MDEKLLGQLRTLDRLYKESDRIYGEYAEHFGLSNTAFCVMYTLGHEPGELTQNDICSAWMLPAQTVNSAVSGLAKRGLLRLEQIPGTKNRKKLVLTESGQRMSRRIEGEIEEIERAALLGFSEAERESYLAMFERHLEYLKREKDRVFGENGDTE